MTDTLTLTEQLAQWNRRATAPMHALNRSMGNSEGWATTLVAACADPKTQSAASWLLLQHLAADDAVLSGADSSALIGHLTMLSAWDAQLHALQILPKLVIAADKADAVNSFVTPLLASNRKLVRAWANYGLAMVAAQHDRFKAGALTTLGEALERETTGSVRVRVKRGIALLTS